VKDEYDKESANDFVLWKGWDEKDGDVFWDTAIGKGRPGWHIECSAMSMKYLGESLDLHAGGVDLIFPHHTNEIAQSEAATGKPFVKYWMHNAHLMVEGKKMSKSLNNFLTLREIKEKGIKPLIFKIELLKNHYRTQSNFSLSGIEEDKTLAGKFVNLLIDLDAVENDGSNNLDIASLISKGREGFISAMDDDLNISLAFTALFEFVSEANKIIKTFNKKQAGEIKQFILEIDSVLGFVEALYENYKIEIEKVKGDKEIVNLLEEREDFRKEKNWAESDKIRDELSAKGVMVNDTAGGYQIRLKEVV
jgi:cysteinyl-tRNA synthetase